MPIVIINNQPLLVTVVLTTSNKVVVQDDDTKQMYSLSLDEYNKQIKHNNQTTNSRGPLNLFIIFIIVTLLVSCSRGITVQQAANGKAKCGRYLR